MDTGCRSFDTVSNPPPTPRCFDGLRMHYEERVAMRRGLTEKQARPTSHRHPFRCRLQIRTMYCTYKYTALPFKLHGSDPTPRRRVPPRPAVCVFSFPLVLAPSLHTLWCSGNVRCACFKPCTREGSVVQPSLVIVKALATNSWQILSTSKYELRSKTFSAGKSRLDIVSRVCITPGP